jgi:hypothetical protein
VYLTASEVTLGVGALTAASAIAATLLTSRKDRKNRELEQNQERKRWEREDRLERERAARENRAAWADKRLAAHAAFAQATRDLILWAQGGWSKYKTIEGGDFNAAVNEFVAKATLVNDTLSELEFFCSPQLRRLAEEVNLASRNAGARAVPMVRMESNEEAIKTWDKACEAAINERRKYVELAQEEIGLLEPWMSPGNAK